MFSTIILSVCSFVCLIVEVFSASICISYHVLHIVVQICTPVLLFKLYHFRVIIQTISFQGYYSDYIISGLLFKLYHFRVIIQGLSSKQVCVFMTSQLTGW